MEGGALEKPEDAGKGVSGEVKRWELELQLADQTEEQWRKDTEEVLKIYRSDQFVGKEKEKRKETFNILWSNVEIKRPSLYNSLPRPDIRRRYRDKDPLGKAVSELMERCATYTLDCQDFDSIMIAAVNDMLLPGRAITRVRYMPTFGKGEATEEDSDENTDSLDYEEVTFEQVQWDRFKHGPGRTWDEVPWCSFEHRLTKDEIEEKFPAFVEKVNYDISIDDEQKKDMDDSEQSVFKRCQVYEIWDKEKREVLFIATSYKDNVIGRESDPLNLKDFFPIPRPLYAIESSTSLIPVPEYTMYETLAKELEKVTNRIRRILSGLRLRGVYDSTFKEMEKLFDAEDNAFIPSEGVSAILERGGLEKAVWMLPVEIYGTVLGQLYEYRNNLIQQIYEITGISDIVRGATDPNETLGAQEIKANFGTQRLQRQQREVQRYARDLIRMAVELMSEQFDRQTLSLMSGLNFPTRMEKQAAQQQAMFAQQKASYTGQPPQIPPQLQQVLGKPAWEEIEQILRSDLLREYRVDIETDSTIQAELQEDQKNIVELITGITKYFEGIEPVVQSGVLPIEAAKQILLTAVRRFKLGRQVEDALEEIEQPPSQPNPEEQKLKAEQQKMQMEMQFKEKEAQMEMQIKVAEAKLEERAKQSEIAFKERLAEMDIRMKQMELVHQSEKNAMDIEKTEEMAEIKSKQAKDKKAA